MKVLLDEGSTLLLTKSRTPSKGYCVRKNAGPAGSLRASSRGTAVPTGTGSCQRVPRYPGAKQDSTKRLFMETEGSLRRASVPNDLASGVAVPIGRSLHCRAALAHNLSGAYAETVWNRGTGLRAGGISHMALVPRFQYAVSGTVASLASASCGRAA